ncbi:MAG: heat-inducible transcriptional repressor HrcA [Alphaproteobacteria bacterium]|nr:heat-inducible transcriptional repressor HrcA [Alphaproteobacteria bacterium]
MTKLEELDKRSREVFRHIVDAYVETGEPVGSKSLSGRLDKSLSPATIRSVMADLEANGLLYAPHTSAGRLPTEAGLRLFVHGILEIGDIAPQEQQEIDQLCKSIGKNRADVLEDATKALCGLSRCAGIVLAPKSESILKHVEFMNLSPGRVLVILITEDGLVENRIIEVPSGIPPSSLIEAGNYLNSRLAGKTLHEAKAKILGELEENRSQLNLLSADVVEKGLAIWAGKGTATSLIVRGQSNLLQDVRHMDELNRIRTLFDALDTQEELVELLDAAIAAQGVQIFIGSENDLFSLSGCSLIVSPYSADQGRVVGAIGVIGPARLNYSRIIPMVDYTAKLISKTIG